MRWPPIAAALTLLFAGRAAAADPKNGVTLVKSDEVELSLSGYVQADWVAYHSTSEDELNPSTREPLNEMRFVIPRARLRTMFEHEIFAGVLEFDGNTLNGPTARILDVEAIARLRSPDPNAPAYLSFAVGSMKVPFGVEVPESERANLFLERTNAARELFPGNYDLGARLEGAWEFLRGTVAAMNGAPIGTRSFAGGDPDKTRDVLGRFGVVVEPAPKLKLSGGVSMLYGAGFHEGSAATKDVLVWRDANENSIVELTEIQVIPATVATPSETFDRFAVGGDLELSLQVPVLGRLALRGELVRSQNLARGETPADPIAAGRDFREWGGYLALTQEFTKYVSAGVRYDRFDPDADATDRLPLALVPGDRTLASWSFNVTGGYAPYGLLTAQLDLNQNPYGLDPSGRPATLADNRFTLRAEAGF